MQVEGVLLLFLLLPMAALSGWYIARRKYSRHRGQVSRNIPPEYLKGLNFVLNEQQDKAIEVFIKMLEVDSDTVETHLALGNLFRRRGEVDRAIRIHQNLIARPTLNNELRSLALLELGTDYMRSGLFDRAEGLFQELVASNQYTAQALSELLDIYQQEKEWNNAINVARKLEAVSGDRLDLEVAQFNCELAQQQLDTGGEKEARNYIKRALNIDPRCVRASILEGRLEQQSGKYKGALRAYNRVVKQDIECLPEVVESMLKCYRETGKLQEFKDYLTELVTNSSGITPVLYLTGLIEELQGTDAAVNYISAQLKKRPTVRGVDKLIDYVMPRVDGELRENLESIKEVTGRLLETHSIYKCNQCGFDALRLHWQCPSCKRWNTIKRVHGVAGE
jgi:lipopolysaccharide biosynthesis regulator YciM